MSLPVTRLDIDPDHTRALARDLHHAASRTPLAFPSPPPLAGPTAALAASLGSALSALERRSRLVAKHLGALSTDAEAFVGNVHNTDSRLTRSWGAAL